MRAGKALIYALLVGTLGCRTAQPPKVSLGPSPTASFKLRGKIVSSNPAAGQVTIDHEAIPGFMGAMTMPYPLKDRGILNELHPGDRITATVTVTKDASGFSDPHLEDIVVVAQARPDYVPKVQYNVPKPGDAVPDFRLLNQSGRTIHLGQFKGKVLLLTFIYTRCPLADFCPRMSRQFAEIDKSLATDAKLYAATHLLSISFDPAYDTPAVLRSYGGAYTAQYTKEEFHHWDFAAPAVKDLPRVTQYFDVGVTPGDAKSLTHSLSTVLIGRDGKIVDWHPSNDWNVAEMVAEIKAAAGA